MSEETPATAAERRVSPGARWADRFLPAAAGIAVAIAATLPVSGFTIWHMAAGAAGLAAAALVLFPRRRTLHRPVASPGAPNPASVSASTVLDALHEPALVIDGRGDIVMANAAMRHVAAAVAPGRPVYEAFRQPELLAAIDRVSAGSAAQTVFFEERGAPPRSFAAHIRPLRPLADRPAGPAAALVWLHDITDQRRTETMRSDFVANVSHELRTPLASVLGFIETLQGPARHDATARERFLGVMREQARRMSRLIDDLLSLSRIELHQHVRPTAVEDIGLIVGHVVETLRPLADEAGVTIRVERPAGPVELPGERDELVRVVENLVENAIKYGGAGKTIDVSLREERSMSPPMVEVAVRDHGPGIAPEHLPRLTERFYRADVAESRGKGGTGLGLAIVKHVVARHGGRLSIESRPGEGALFRILLPLAAPGQGPAAAVTKVSSR